MILKAATLMLHKSVLSLKDKQEMQAFDTTLDEKITE